MTAVLLLVFLLGALRCSAEAPAGSGDGSIRILMSNIYVPGEQVAGVKFKIYRVADGSPYEGARTCGILEGSGISADDLTQADSGVIAKLSELAENGDAEAAASGETDASGEAAVSNLPDGIYFIVQNNTEADFERLGYTASFKPFLVYLPAQNSDGSFTHSVVCRAKCEKQNPEPETVSISVEKHWEDENNKYDTRPDSIDAALMDDGKKVEQVTLSPENNWHHEWDNLDPDVKWSVDEVNLPNYYKKDIKVDKSGNLTIYTITNTLLPTEEGKVTPTPTPPVTPGISPTPTPSVTPGNPDEPDVTPSGGGGGGGNGNSGSGGSRTSLVKTGDYSEIRFFTVLMFVSAAVILGVSLRKKKM